jgi:hypothetical protein
MNRNENNLLVFVLTGLLLLAVTGPLFAASGEFPKTTGPGLRAFWVTGTVTKAPWTDADQQTRITVDEDEYVFVSKNVRLEREIRDPSGIWHVEPISSSAIHTGQHVMIRVAGPHIYELMIEEQY